MNIPTFLYGTAWKEDATEELTRRALAAGFRGIDTANQRKHYFEAGVGAGIAGFPREELFLQTKYTYLGGQDDRLPYDPAADLPTQVHQSFASSLEHLGVTTLDSYILHGPSRRRGLGKEDIAVWRAMEELHADGKTRYLGISNVEIEQIRRLVKIAKVHPMFVQNRCYASMGWDDEIRDFCRANSIVYQGFSLLTANDRELRKPAFRKIVTRTGRTPAQVVFRFARQVGMLPLTGTKDETHMREDLAIDDFTLSDDEVRTIEGIGL